MKKKPSPIVREVTIGPCRLIQGDCTEVLPLLDKVDAVVTDPPYGLGKRLTGRGNSEWNKHFEVSPDWDKQIVDGKFIESLSQTFQCIIWGGNYYELPPVRGWIIWHKMQEHSSGHFEMAWTNLDIPTRSFQMSRGAAYSQMNKCHPTQKPVKLMEWCLSFLDEAKVVFDPFMGSGTTGVACIRTGRKFIGIEKEPKYFDIAIKRINQAWRNARLAKLEKQWLKEKD